MFKECISMTVITIIALVHSFDNTKTEKGFAISSRIKISSKFIVLANSKSQLKKCRTDLKVSSSFYKRKDTFVREIVWLCLQNTELFSLVTNSMH